MAGNRSVACNEGRLSLARERGRVRFDSKTPIIVQTPHLYPLPFPRGEARKECADLEPYLSRTQYPVAGCSRNPFKLCDFQLVTQISLLY
jgi:hypothetical protein